jgi:geranylgeranyl pyrophosphate synthase
LRRGKPCTYKKFGVDITINAGNAIYFLPMLVLKREDIDANKRLKIYETYTQEMTNISLGQGMDIFWHKGGKEPDEQGYLQMCAFKTGTLARMAAKFAAILAGLKDDEIERIGRFAETVGVAFQIQDDILNIAGSKNWGKEHGDDITEGKRSLMVIHALSKANDDDKKRLIEVLNMHTKDRKLIDEAVGILKKYDSIKYAKTRATEIIKESWDGVKDLFPEGESKNKIEAFVTFMVARKI